MRKIMAMLLALGVLAGCSSSGGGSEGAAPADKTTSTEKATTTTTEATTTTERVTTTTAAPYEPKPEDFQIQIIETERECFGSAGCSIDWRIAVNYTGQPMRPGDSYEVVYDVIGAEQKQTSSFNIDAEGIQYDEERTSTAADTPISAKATAVLAN